MIPDNINDFLYESNLIEGINIPEGTLEDYWEQPYERATNLFEAHARNSCQALQQAIRLADKPLSVEIICLLHKTQMDNFLSPSTCGKFRTVRVVVGGDTCPDPKEVPKLVEKYVALYNKKTWHQNRLHFEFEAIHPFIDGNGRTGRLIYAMDLVRRKIPIASILNEFGSSLDDFYVKRSHYYAAIRYHKEVLELIKRGI